MKLLARRSILALPLAIGASALLAGCSFRNSGRAKTGSKNTGSHRPPGATVMPNGAVMFDTVYLGKALNIEVGPVAVHGDKAVARILFSTDSNDPVSLYKAFDIPDKPNSMVGMRLLSLKDGLVFPELNTSPKGLGDPVSKNRKSTIFPIFKAPSQATKSVELFIPNMGIALNIPIVPESDFDRPVEDILSEASIDEVNQGPYFLESVIVGPDGDSDVNRSRESTTVTVSGDVTFASDSSELSGKADTVLSTVAEQVRLYPSGGKARITGHTDDVADDQHNQTLSERRAKAVSERLKVLVDMSKWKVSTAGLGETSPRVDNDSDEHRQLNRRVEIELIPVKPEESNSKPAPSASGSSTDASDKASGGPTDKGIDGVDVMLGDRVVHLSLPSVTRVGKYLCGSVLLTTVEKTIARKGSFELPSRWESLRRRPGGWALLDPASNLTLLEGQFHYLPSDYADSNGGYLPLSNIVIADLVAGDTRYLPVVWPDLGTDTVTLDLPGGTGTHGSPVSARLTDIPVVDA